MMPEYQKTPTKVFSAAFLLSILFMASGNVYAKSKTRTITGRIVSYDCGDNCYLTIKDSKGKEHSGLCSAAVCQKWNEAVEMPERYKGDMVRIQVGTDWRYDDGGNRRDKMDSFQKIDFFK